MTVIDAGRDSAGPDPVDWLISLVPPAASSNGD